MKQIIHFHKSPHNVLTTLCGEFVHGQKHTFYKNRVTCKVCLDKLKKLKI